MKRWTPEIWSKVDNRIAYLRKRKTPNLQESRFLVMILKQTQDKYEALKRTNSPILWEEISKGGVTFQEFATAFDLNLTNTQSLKDRLYDMLGFSFEIGFETGDVEGFPLFMRCRFSPSTNKIWWQLNPLFKEYFNPIANFFKLSIGEVSSMDSNYAILLYMFLKSKLGNTKKTGDKYSLSELRAALGITNKYPLFGHFKTRVLDIAKAQINQSPACEFYIEYEPLYTGKKVNDIWFTLTNKRKEGNYYEVTKKLPNYKKTQEYKRYKKLKEHESQIIADLATRIIFFADEHGFNTEQQLLQYYITAIEKEIENFNNLALPDTLLKL